ncbi:MAG: Gfo/Idh/MocA family oxidoreductase [Bacteroidia bacterium]
MINILLIGAGQLGSRHLQALALLKIPVTIQVIDLSQESLQIAEIRFKEVADSFNGTISFHTSMSEINPIIDVAIIATNSNGRRTIVEKLTSLATVKNIIFEKFLFTNIDDYAAVTALLEKKKISAWVNCPRRMMSIYQEIRNELIGPIQFSAIGSSWGLGCNGIHFLDLFAYLTNSTEIILSNNLIDKKIIDSKRSGYIEFTGTITGYSSNHSFHITSYATANSPLQLIIDTPTIRYVIFEGSLGKVLKYTAKNNWQLEEFTFEMPFQSKLTNVAVTQIAVSGSCELTPFIESSKLHLVFLNNLISFLQTEIKNNPIRECMIT